MSEKIKVICSKCASQFKAMDDELDKLSCPNCGGKLQPASDQKVSVSVTQEQENNKSQIEGAKIISDSSTPEEKLKKLGEAVKIINNELEKVIVGQKEVIEEIIVAIVANGHCLLEGVPGLAKTLLISSISKAMSLSFKRIQFTPDLMPSDITGTDVIQDDPVTGKREFKFLHGPIFANIILADEINRTPPKTQAAMLEAMQEKQVSVGGKIHKLPKPFFVLATQNPLEQEGTYPRPEAQQDRFLFKIFVGYPEKDEEKKIIELVTGQKFGEIQPILNAEDIINAQKLAISIPVADTVVEYATNLVRSTRLNQPDTPDFVKKWVAWGCGPRASISLISAAKAYAAITNQTNVSCEHIDRMAHPVMRHRLAVNYTARAEGVNTDTVIDKLLETTKKY